MKPRTPQYVPTSILSDGKFTLHFDLPLSGLLFIKELDVMISTSGRILDELASEVVEQHRLAKEAIRVGNKRR